MSGWTEADVRRMQPAVSLPPATGRLAKPKMNKTESAYAQHLEALRAAGEVLWWGFEVVKVRIGHDCWLLPDFLVMLADGRLELHDTKGTKRVKRPGASKEVPWVEEDARVKARAVGDRFPIPMFLVYRTGVGEWARVEM